MASSVIDIPTLCGKVLGRYDEGMLVQRPWGAKVLYLSGTPTMMGLQHGHLLANTINTILPRVC